jgi:dimeric dUTPase (all-alpha-NTP-PPase superfamily)
MKVYADTSVFGGVFDQEFSEPSQQFFDEVHVGRFILVTSAIVEAEIEPAHENIRTLFATYAQLAHIAVVNQEALDL